jgi:hypothetical protein
MLRTILIGSFAALLAMGGIQSANALESASQTGWAQARRACAAVGIAPGSGDPDQCVVDLYYSLWNEENETER